MRLAGVFAVSPVRMSFSRRIGVSPSISRRVRWSVLVTTQSPIMTRSPGFSSTLRAMTASLSGLSRSFRKTVNGALRLERAAPVSTWTGDDRLTEQLEDRLVRLRRQRQGRDRQLLPGLQGQHVGALQVGVGEGEPIGAG